MKFGLVGGLLILTGLALFIIGLAVSEGARSVSYALGFLGAVHICIGSGMQIVRARED